ncbi:hypothetical protein [Algoriphagus litoralis]|uniref:hypothetical protein n=1 Tax=Algoriphagus litoralis TaxID=2202829 RepID=UPI000DB8FDE6|nr:hypothetical protein [Algoriphagus litoralis]
MKLSPDQINTVKKLISFKGYEEIDVQYEILDHVACRIEVLMEENPKLTLEEAFRKTHSEFGIFGFSDLADSYRESIRKKFWRRYWTSLRNLLTSYRVVYFFLLGWTFNFISQNFTFFGERLTAPGWAVIGLMISVVFFLIYFHRVGKNYKNYASFKHGLSFFGGFQLIIHISIQGMRFLMGPEIPMELNFQGIMAWITIIAMSICWVSIFLLPKIIKEAAEETEKLKAIYEGT